MNTKFIASISRFTEHIIPLGQTAKLSTHPRRRPSLRQQLLREGACSITGWKSPEEIECAHILPRSIGYNIGFRNTDTLENCILFSRGLHSLFDNMRWTVDIFGILDYGVQSESYFSAMIITYHNIQPGTSALSEYVNKLIKFPTRNYASLYLHYMAYLMYNYTLIGNRNLTEIYKLLTQPESIYYNLTNLKSTTEIREYLLNLREIKSKNLPDGEYPAICIVADKNNQYKVVWDLYSQTHITWEPEKNVRGNIIYEQYCKFKDVHRN